MIAVAPRHMAIHDHEVMKAGVRRGHALIAITGKPYLAAKRLEEEAGEPSMERVIFDHQDPDGRNAGTVRYSLTIRRGRPGFTHGASRSNSLYTQRRPGVVKGQFRLQPNCWRSVGDMVPLRLRNGVRRRSGLTRNGPAFWPFFSNGLSVSRAPAEGACRCVAERPMAALGKVARRKVNAPARPHHRRRDADRA